MRPVPKKGRRFEIAGTVKDVSESQDDYCDTSAQADIVLGKLTILVPPIANPLSARSWTFRSEDLGSKR